MGGGGGGGDTGGGGLALHRAATGGTRPAPLHSLSTDTHGAKNSRVLSCTEGLSWHARQASVLMRPCSAAVLRPVEAMRPLQSGNE